MTVLLPEYVEASAGMKRIWNSGWKIAAIVLAVVAIPTAALAATGAFTSTTATPAVTGTNSSAAATATGVLGANTGGGSNTRYGVSGTANGTGGVGVNGAGTKYGVYSNGPLGVAAGNKLTCAGCVTGSDIANRLVVNYSLVAGANTTPVTIQANRPVQVMGVQTNEGYRGVASATLLRIPDSFLEWTGLESTAASAITQGFNSAPGTHILYLDFSHQVDIQVNDANSIRVHNASTVPMAGIVVLTW